MDFSTTTSTIRLQTGGLKITVTMENQLIPVENADVTITTDSLDSFITNLKTDSSGQTTVTELPAPAQSYSLEEDNIIQPYSLYTVTVKKEGLPTIIITGIEILSGQTAILPVKIPKNVGADEAIVIPPHTLYGDYPPKIPEPEIKEEAETGEIVLSRVVIPEYIIVHDGPPNDTSAKNYYVPYVDYIKNVVCSEIYATWPENTIYANALVIQSFTLNRVYTEFYRNKGYNFTITSSTAYDQKWIYGRNIFSNVDYIVDSIFANYLSRPGVKQPIFTSYCDGNKTSCSGLSQWGSKTLGDRGYSAIEILRYYYGNDIYINSSEFISGIPSSWPGYNLNRGASGSKVRQIQQQLNRISKNYPLIPQISTDGIYGSKTAEAVKTFQKIFNLPQSGIVDYPTWYEISRVFVGVSRLSEP